MKKLWVLAGVLLLLAGCKKDIDTLPEETQTGAGTFGAVVNGENWGPLKAGLVPTAPLLEARYTGNNSIVINARNFSRMPVETEMEIYLKNVEGPRVFLLTEQTAAYPNQTASYAYFVRRKVGVEDEWITGGPTTGQVVVTRIDGVNKVISGTFQFTATARYGSAPLTVTDGRFDVKIQ